jgi:hypothetical protein
VLPDRLEQPERRQRSFVEGEMGVADGATDVGVGGEVPHLGGAAERIGVRGRLLQVRERERESRRARKMLASPFREIVDHPHVPAAREELADEHRSDRARAARDHGRTGRLSVGHEGRAVSQGSIYKRTVA